MCGSLASSSEKDIISLLDLMINSRNASCILEVLGSALCSVPTGGKADFLVSAGNQD